MIVVVVVEKEKRIMYLLVVVYCSGFFYLPTKLSQVSHVLFVAVPVLVLRNELPTINNMFLLLIPL
jgi:hypothetical protein